MRPEIEDVPKFYRPYLEAVKGDDIVDILSKAKSTTLELLSGLTEENGNYAYAEGKWTIKELLQHIIDSEVVFGYRALWIMRGAKGDLLGFDQDDWVIEAPVQDIDMNALIDKYSNTRDWVISLFTNATDAQLLRIGTANGYPIKALILPYLIAGHNLHHIKIIKERYL
jgi:hypothetical protein